MDDKKTKTNGSEQDIDLLTKKAKEEKAEFGSAGHDDINKNLGSFGDTKVQQAAVNEVKLDVDAKVVEKASQEKINFERFSKTKRSEKAAKTKFGEKVSIMLRSKKGLRATWIIEMVVMVAVIIGSSLFLGFLMKYRNFGVEKWPPIELDHVRPCLKTGLVFAWISLFPCLIPLIYLLTTWFIGINQVASSRIYHYMFWICGAVSLICFIVAFGLLMVPCQYLWVPIR